MTLENFRERFRLPGGGVLWHPAWVSFATEPDTIVAISTPPGRGGIGIVRLSGPGAVVVARRLMVLRAPLEHARAIVARVVDTVDAPHAQAKQIPCGNDNQEGDNQTNEVTLDEAVVTAFFAPRSYTGEDLIEIAAHGSPVVLAALVQAALDTGVRLGVTVRLAGPGEFTQRAFLAGRIDLTQAEAIHDLIAAQTLDQARVAAQQMGGALARQVAPAKAALLHLIALLEAGMDFASGELDDVDVVPPAQIAQQIAQARQPLAALASTFRRGQLLREGAAIALVGRPNAGKSSLFNRLLERERAIVTPVPGTTRDTLEEAVALGGMPLRLIDTAGLRLAEDAADEAEAQGITRTHEALADADLVLFVHDATQPFAPAETALVTQIAARPHLLIWNKVDLPGADWPLPGREIYGVAEETQIPFGKDKQAGKNKQEVARQAIYTSAVTGEGLERLRAAILRALNAEGSLSEGAVLSNVRQQQSVAGALSALAAAAEANCDGLPHEVLLMDLHTALRALDSLTGVTTTEDILARIFATFCIGK